MGNAFWFSWEPGVITFIQSWITPLWQKFFEAVTFLGDEYAIILVIGFLYWGYRKDLGKKIGIYFVTSLVATVMLGNIVVRRRPYFDHSDIKCLKPRSSKGDPYDITIQGFSFPSGHATNSVSTYAALGCNTEKKVLKAVLFLMPVLIGLSRLALGIHYPTDILAGWAVSALVILMVSSIRNQHIVYLIVLAVGLTGCFFCKSADFFSSLGIAFGMVTGFLFEEKYVRFENTEKVSGMILRTLGGLVVFVLTDKLLEVPFSKEFLASSSSLSFAVRSIRYMISCFTVLGVYPMLFGRIGGKLRHGSRRSSEQ